MRSDPDKTKVLFLIFDSAGGGPGTRAGPGRAGPGTAGHPPRNFQYFGPAPEESSSSRPHTASHARTHARTHTRTAPRPKPKSISRLDTPPNLQSTNYRCTCVRERVGLLPGCYLSDQIVIFASGRTLPTLTIRKPWMFDSWRSAPCQLHNLDSKCQMPCRPLPWPPGGRTSFCMPVLGLVSLSSAGISVSAC